MHWAAKGCYHGLEFLKFCLVHGTVNIENNHLLWLVYPLATLNAYIFHFLHEFRY